MFIYIFICLYIYIYIYISTHTHTHTRVLEKVLSLTQILHSSRTSHFCIGLTGTEIKREI